MPQMGTDMTIADLRFDSDNFDWLWATDKRRDLVPLI